MRRLIAALGLSFAVAACEENLPPPVVAPQPAPPPATTAAPDADPIGKRPTLEAPKAFTPPTPEVIKAPNGMTVWLIERHTLPIVSASLTVPYGSASDPKGKAGLSHITADMLDEGAGSRSAVELSTAVNDLGASLSTRASMDGSIVTLGVLKKNWRPAFEIFGDVVARPRFEAKEWKRVSDLWKNDLRKRPQDPSAVSRVITASALFGPDSPYGHPVDGFVDSAAKIDLRAAKGFYEAHWRPDRATLIVAGDITKDELMDAVRASLGGWKAPAAPAAEPPAPAELRSPRPRLVLVDRPDAPQSVIAVVREGVAARDPRAPLLDLVNTALGGSFTSRLNQNLREDHGWTYGAGSAFGEARGRGSFVARASVVTEATGPALKEMLGELSKMAASGLSGDEIEKVRAQDRADLVQSYESVGGISRRLGALAMLGLPPEFDTTASRERQQATQGRLAELAKLVDPASATIVVVGPRGAVAPQLAAIGLEEPELWDPEGSPLKGAATAPKKPQKAK